jgi:hypothetical protein
MKKMFGLIILIFISFYSYCEIVNPGFKPGTIQEDKYLIGIATNVNQIDVNKSISQSYDFAFKDKDDRYEIRYIMFVEDGPINDIKMQAGFWSYIVTMNIAGDEKAIKNATIYKDEDVKNEFNADYGSFVFIIDSKTDFSNNYKYMLCNYFYKKGVGLMTQCILFKDITQISQNEIGGIFHSFKFY